MGGKGPGSCMTGGKNREVPSPQRHGEQGNWIDAHESAWELEKEHAGRVIGKVMSRWKCSICKVVTVEEQGNTPANVNHPRMRKPRGS